MPAPLTVQLSDRNRSQISALVAALDAILTKDGARHRPRLVLSLQSEGENEPRNVATVELADDLRSLLRVLAQQDTLLVEGLDDEISPLLAAELLRTQIENVDRLIEGGELPVRGTGPYRRLPLRDVLKRVREEEVRRGKARRDLTALSEDFGLYKS